VAQRNERQRLRAQREAARNRRLFRAMLRAVGKGARVKGLDATVTYGLSDSDANGAPGFRAKGFTSKGKAFSVSICVEGTLARATRAKKAR
jgi:hypothetical protein